MRRVKRRSSGGSADERSPRREAKPTASASESTDWMRDATRTGACRSEPLSVRSGVVAFGSEATGQPLQSEAASISIGETRLFERPSALSRAHIETQATNSQMKLIGSSVAIIRLCGKRVINIAKIIHSGYALRHSSQEERQSLSAQGYRESSAPG